jgi:biopolymer transport protein TolR
MHAHIASDDEPMADMNLIPLIDIALTLLIIMMVTTVFVKHPGVSLKLPETATREGAPETKKDLTIVVASTGQLYIDAVQQTPEEIQARLHGVAAKNKDSRVLVKGDRDVAYAKIVDVMDMVRQAGLTRVVLPTDPKTPGYAKPGAANPNTMDASAGAAFSSAGQPTGAIRGTPFSSSAGTASSGQSAIGSPARSDTSSAPSSGAAPAPPRSSGGATR